MKEPDGVPSSFAIKLIFNFYLSFRVRLKLAKMAVFHFINACLWHPEREELFFGGINTAFT